MARTRSGKLDEGMIRQIIKDAESATTFDSLSDLWKEVAKVYNARKGTNISHTVIGLRVKEWKISVNTISGRAKAAAIDLKHLQGLIREVEAKGLPANRSALFMEVAKLLSERKRLNISFSAVGALAKKNGLEIKTPKGERGSFLRNGGSRGPRGPRTSRKDKFLGNERIQEIFADLKKTFPERFQPVVTSIMNGSMKAAVKAKCLECSDFQTSEIRLCPVECPLWAFRPYQGAVKNGEPVEETEDDDTEADVEE